MARNRQSGPPGIHEVNLTPLIDVSLVLVVILLVATPLAFQSSFAVPSATAAGRQAQKKADEDRIELIIHDNGDVTVNRQRVPGAALSAVLEQAMAASSSRLVVVRCEDAVPHGVFVRVLDRARELGAGTIAVVGRS